LIRFDLISKVCIATFANLQKFAAPLSKYSKQHDNAKRICK